MLDTRAPGRPMIMLAGRRVPRSAPLALAVALLLPLSCSGAEPASGEAPGVGGTDNAGGVGGAPAGSGGVGTGGAAGVLGAGTAGAGGSMPTGGAGAGGPGGDGGGGAAAGSSSGSSGTSNVDGGAGGNAGDAAGAGMAGSSAGTSGAAGTGPGGYEPPPATRTSTLIDDGWRFIKSNPSGAEGTSYDDSSWTAVTLPHTWNAQDGQDGGNNYYRGTGWYRRHFMLPASAAGKKVYLEFDGANIVTDVFVNGKNVGQHRGGFARFRFDVTDEMTSGDNVIAVRVSNAAASDVAPLEADFTFFGGIYRDVHVLVTDTLHIDTLDYASDGVYLDPTSVSAASAALASRVRVTNERAGAEAVTVDTVVVDPDGAVVDTLSGAATVMPAATNEVKATASITSPRLWNGRTAPNVYTAYAIVRSGDTVVELGECPARIPLLLGRSRQGLLLERVVPRSARRQSPSRSIEPRLGHR